ncbi:MAG: rod shape-determining protein MreD [Alphaproteobacteria bacterium]|nr:rod shape-determining protein MreD [Alphaproteobacteria bacterium]
MFDVVWQRLDYGARLSLPFITALLGVLLGVLAWPLPHLGAVAPPFALMMVYYWAIHRPDLFRPWMAFLIGFLNDIVHSLPLGLSALLFVAAHQVIFRQRRFFVGHSFSMIWWGFALTVFLVTLAAWILQNLIAWTFLPVLPAVMQCVLAIVLFPLPCWLLIRLQRAAFPQG